jgi:hypothetical protein
VTVEVGAPLGIKRQIQEWFETHEDGDGDFFISPSGYPFSVIPPKADTESIVYCTKQHCLLELVRELGDDHTVAAVMRGGLPSVEEADWLSSMVGSRRLLFLGDADPADLLIFAWLREHLPVQHVGLSDRLLRQCGVESRDNLTIALSEPEVSALPLVTQCLGALMGYLGPRCSRLLFSGRKTELEALFSFAACGPSELEAALLQL